MVTYTTLMTILSRIEERKAIIGLYNYAHEMTHGARWASRCLADQWVAPSGSAPVVTLMLCVPQWPGVPQAGPDDRGLWEPFEEDDGGICPAWKGKRKKLSGFRLHRRSTSPFFCICRLLLKKAPLWVSSRMISIMHHRFNLVSPKATVAIAPVEPILNQSVWL